MLGRPYPRGEEYGPVSCSAVEAVPKQDAYCERLGVEEDESATWGVSAEENMICSS
ncbi:hypothetical protein A2U01_0093538 [Trifolium medium]|uniref:Uncharacterized protein n=1 Tax=Trifolium medium TaxID=97028 RepID=A0A392UKK1_9FABA|nr:hypothetical protein [Trifolium medium]